MKKRGLLLSAILTIAMSGATYASAWETQDGRWTYRWEDGSLAASSWIQEGGSWYYVGQDGAMRTGWLKADGKWYYLEPSGAMISGRRENIDGVWYTFSASGAWLEEGVGNQYGPGYQKGDTRVEGIWENDLYISPDLDFRISRPAGYVSFEQDLGNFVSAGMDLNFSFGREDGGLAVAGCTYHLDQLDGAGLDAGQLITLLQDTFVDNGPYQSGSRSSAVLLGRYGYEKLAMKADEETCQDIYVRQVDEKRLFMLQIMYRSDLKSEADYLVSSIR